MDPADQPTQPIRQIDAEPAVTAPAPRPPRRRPRSLLPTLAAALAILALVAALALVVSRLGEPGTASLDATQTTVASNASPAPAVSQPSPSAQTRYTVRAGDTMKSIAQAEYGDPEAWRRIYDANQAAIGANPDSLRVGMELTIPPR